MYHYFFIFFSTLRRRRILSRTIFISFIPWNFFFFCIL